MYLSKTDPLNLLSLDPFGFLSFCNCSAPVQAYIIIDDKQGVWDDVSKRDKQSNTFGVVMIQARAKSVQGISMRPTPRLYKNYVVMLLARNITIPQPFTWLPLRCLTNFESDDSQKLYASIAKGLEFLRSEAKGKRAIIRAVGHAKQELQRMINKGIHSVSLSSVSESDAEEEREENRFPQRDTVLLPRQVLQEFEGPGGNKPRWPETSEWMTDLSGSTSVHEGRPGILGEGTETARILDSCRDDLRECLSQVVARSPVLDIIAAVRVGSQGRARSPKCRKMQQSQSTLILNIDFDNLPVVLRTSVKHSLVWLIKRTTLETLLQEGRHTSIFQTGSLHLITGHSPDSRRVYVQPPLAG